MQRMLVKSQKTVFAHGKLVATMNEKLSSKKWIRFGSLILCVSIILSTVLIKQHSMFDVLTAFIMAAVMYAAVYSCNVVSVYRYQLAKRARRRA